VRFLVDAQLPPLLARYLVAAGYPAEHVSDLGLDAASDREIWARAADLGAVIVTKDEDFVTLRALQSEVLPLSGFESETRREMRW
jgi:predicted nuclease of predicted toxin-antitoxin system